MAKVIKDREDFINENYYETSSTVVPGQGVGPGLFHTVGSARVTEKNVPQEGANGVKSDPDYTDPARNTHATFEGGIQLGDIVEDINPECPYFQSFGKAFTIMGSGPEAKVQYIIANESENYAIGEVANIEMRNLRLVKKYQLNESVNEAKFDKKKLLKAIKNKDDAMILANGMEYIIYNPDNGNDDNADMWGDKTIFALDPDGEEHEIKYSDIERVSENINEAKFVKDFNKKVLDAKTKEEVLKVYPKTKFFVGKMTHFFGELEPNLFFKAYYAKYYEEDYGKKIKGDFKITLVYSEKGSRYVNLYNEKS